VKKVTAKPLIVVNTHGHPDHAAGNYQFKTVYVHPADMDAARKAASAESRARSVRTTAGAKTAPDMMTAEEAATYGNPELRPVKDGFIFDLGGRKLEVIEVSGHTAGEIVLLDSANRQVFTGDNDNTLVWLFLPGGPSLDVYLKSLQKLQARGAEFTTIYPGHGTPEPASLVGDQIKAVESILDGTCKSAPYQSFAGKATQCKYGRATVAYDPDNLRAKK
jgi:hydroxyacylglutathione hydrolase